MKNPGCLASCPEIIEKKTGYPVYEDCPTIKKNHERNRGRKENQHSGFLKNPTQKKHASSKEVERNIPWDNPSGSFRTKVERPWHHRTTREAHGQRSERCPSNSGPFGYIRDGCSFAGCAAPYSAECYLNKNNKLIFCEHRCRGAKPVQLLFFSCRIFFHILNIGNEDDFFGLMFILFYALKWSDGRGF